MGPSGQKRGIGWGQAMNQGFPRPSSASRVENDLWRFANAHGIARRDFLRLMVAGGVAAVLSACWVGTDDGMSKGAPAQSPDPTAQSALWFKDPDPFRVHEPGGLETRLENLQGLITPNRLFFVRNNSVSLDLHAEDWRLEVEGDGVDDPAQLTYADIQRLPAHTLTAYLECAGNHRAMFDIIKRRKASGAQWMTGAVSNGEWVGASLADVLTLAGIRPDATDVLLIGLDTESPEGGFRYVLPVEKALHPDTLLAYALNGEALPRDHSFPVRALVPGWVGSANIKWLGKIVVSSQQVWTRNNTNSYVLIGDEYPAVGESAGQPVTQQAIKSALALPWPATLIAGRHRIHGYAHSPHGPIERVEWSLDSGKHWSDADVSSVQVDYSWARFEFVWDAGQGEHTIMTRAHDGAGHAQPDDIPFNDKRYLFNQPLPHPVHVTS